MLTGVCSNKHKLGYKFMDVSFGKFGEGGKGNSYLALWV